MVHSSLTLLGVKCVSAIGSLWYLRLILLCGGREAELKVVVVVGLLMPPPFAMLRAIDPKENGSHCRCQPFGSHGSQ
jgi:hypothetical protein